MTDTDLAPPDGGHLTAHTALVLSLSKDGRTLPAVVRQAHPLPSKVQQIQGLSHTALGESHTSLSTEKQGGTARVYVFFFAYSRLVLPLPDARYALRVSRSRSSPRSCLCTPWYYQIGNPPDRFAPDAGDLATVLHPSQRACI